MEWIDFVRIVEFPIILGLAGYMWKLNNKMNDHIVTVAKDYAQKTDVEKMETKIDSRLARMEDKIDRMLERSKDDH